MPKLHLPFLLKSTSQDCMHNISRLFLLVNQQKILTVSHQGDIIIWQIKDTVDSMDSRLYLTPSLENKAGPLTAMTTLTKPLHFYTEGIMTCLVTIHRDNRIRIWNLEDGRCFSVSHHSVFKSDVEIIQIQMLEMLNSESRLLFCIGRDKKLLIVDIWSNELVKSVEVSKVGLVCFKLDPEHFTIHFLNLDNEYIVWNLESYYKEDINNYRKFIENNLEKRADPLKSTKEILKHRLRLSGSNQDPPLNFILEADCPFLFVLFSDRVMIYKLEEVLTEKEKVKSFITLNFVNQTSLISFHLLSVKCIQYLMILTMTGNVTSVTLKDIQHLWDLQENAQEELNFNHADFSFFKNISSNSAYLTIKSVNLIYQNDQDIFSYLKSNPGSTFHLSSFDSTTNTLLIHNPVEKSLTFFDCELEIQKVKGKIKLLDLPKPVEKRSSRTLKHKTSLVLSSGKEKLSIIASIEESPREGGSGKKLSDSFNKFDSLVAKTMTGYLKHFLIENRPENTINDHIHSLFSISFRERLLKSTLPFQFSQGQLIQGVLHTEKPSATLCCYVGQHLFYFLGSNIGNVYVFPFLFNTTWSYYPFFLFQNQTNTFQPIKSFTIHKNCLFVEQGESMIHVLGLNFEGESPETQAFFSNLPEPEQINQNTGIQPIHIKSWLQKTIDLDSNLSCFAKIKMLPFSEDSPSENALNFSSFKASLSPIAIILDSNNILIYSLSKHDIELELKGNSEKPLCIFLHPFLDEIMVLNQKGYIYVHNLPNGVLDRIVSIETYSHLFNFSRFLQESFHRNNVHNLAKFLEVEDAMASKTHYLVDYSLRTENYLMDYSFGKEFCPRRTEISSQMKQTVSSNILLGTTVNVELASGDHNNNSNAGSAHNLPGLVVSKHDSENETGTLEQAYHQKKALSLLQMVYERNGAFIQNILKKPEKEHANVISDLMNSRSRFIPSRNKEQGIGVIPFRNGHLLFFDLKINVRNQRTKSLNGQYFSFMGLSFPWGIDKEFDQKVLNRIQNTQSVFQVVNGVQGCGESFTFLMSNKDKWGFSDYFSTLQAISMLYFITHFEDKELKSFTGYFLKIIEAFSKKKRLHEKLNPCVNFPLICKYFLDDDGELMTAAYNLLISGMKNKDVDFSYVLQNCLGLYKLTSNDKLRPDGFSYSLVIWTLMIGYTSVFYEKSRASAEDCIKDIILLTDIKNCVKTPSFVCGSLKLILDASHLLKNYPKETLDFLDKMVYIYFVYYLSNETQSPLSSSESKSNPTNRVSVGNTTNSTFGDLKNIEKQRPEIKKTTKHIVSKVISAIGIIFMKEFLKLLKEQILNVTPHFLYPTAIIDIIRNFLKSQNPKQVHKFLHNFVEVILKTLDPNNPNLRKVCHKPASQALHTIYKLYDMVSFHPTSQKFAIGTVENVIILYDLRTAVKWKVLEGHQGPISCMNFDEAGKYLASFSVGDSTVRIWKIGTTGFFSSILGMQGKHFKLFDVEKKKYLNENLNSDMKFSLVWTEKDNHCLVTLNIGEKKIESYDIVE